MSSNVEAVFSIEPSQHPVAAAERARLLENPAFGRVFSDHMATIRYTEGKGWHDAGSPRAAPSSAIRPCRCSTTHKRFSRG